MGQPGRQGGRDRRARTLAARFPDGSIVGEEHATKAGTSGFVWIVDPIDGTTNFITGIPTWTVALAGVASGQTGLGVIHDPFSDETFTAIRGGGAFLNGVPLALGPPQMLTDGTLNGYSNRVSHSGILDILDILDEIDAAGGMVLRNTPGALSLAFVAAGRLLGYAKQQCTPGIASPDSSSPPRPGQGRARRPCRGVVLACRGCSRKRPRLCDLNRRDQHRTRGYEAHLDPGALLVWVEHIVLDREDRAQKGVERKRDAQADLGRLGNRRPETLPRARTIRDRRSAIRPGPNGRPRAGNRIREPPTAAARNPRGAPI